jgi:hypothetical protein
MVGDVAEDTQQLQSLEALELQNTNLRRQNELRRPRRLPKPKHRHTAFSFPDVEGPLVLCNVLLETHRTTVHVQGETSDGANCKELILYWALVVRAFIFSMLVVAVKSVVSIDPFVIAVGPDPLNYGTQPKGAMRREDRVGSLQAVRGGV